MSGSDKGTRATRRVAVRVQPRASRNEIVGVRDGVIRIRLHAPPVDNAANDALVRFLAEEFGVPVRMVRIVSGFGSRTKVIEVEPVAFPALDRLLSTT